MDTRVGKLEDEAVKRKERLKALRSRQQDTTGQEYDNGTAIKHDLTSTNIH